MATQSNQTERPVAEPASVDLSPFDSTLESLAERVDEALEADKIEAGRRDFFAAFRLLQTGDLDGAIVGFRRAARSSRPPFDALSLVALGECERVNGREAAALRQWQRVGSDPSAPPTARTVAWLSIAALAERREDPRLGKKAAAALEKLGKITDINPSGATADH